MNFKRENYYPCMCMRERHSESASVRHARLNGSVPKIPGALNDDPFVNWYRCRQCGRCLIRILFEGYQSGSFTFYAANVEKDAIEAFHMDQIDEIFLAAETAFVGGYDRSDHTSVYTGGFPVDPWYGFRKEERLQKAKNFAIKAHGPQLYGDRPYEVHLMHVHKVMQRYRNTNTDLLVQIAAWLHDVLEDTPTPKGELEKHFGKEVADIVYRVTDEPGVDRWEKKRKTYRKIRCHIDATTVKLCDRIANVEASSVVPEKLEMYKNEHKEFKAAVCIQKHNFLLGDLWRHLDQLLGFGIRSKDCGGNQ